MKDEIKTFQCDSLEEAEALYFLKRQEGCWQMVRCLKIVWSWKKFRYVAEFKMKKVEKAYHFDDYMKDVSSCIAMTFDTLKNVTSIIAKHKPK